MWSCFPSPCKLLFLPSFVVLTSQNETKHALIAFTTSSKKFSDSHIPWKIHALFSYKVSYANFVEKLLFGIINTSSITYLSEILSKEDILQNFKRNHGWSPTEAFCVTIWFSNKCWLLNAFVIVYILFLVVTNVDVYKASLFVSKASCWSGIQFCCEAENKTND